MILPRKTVLELGKLLTDSDDPVTLDILANQVRFRFANVELVSKVVDGKFPDFNRVIPVGHTKMVELDRVTALAALQRAAILSNEKFRGVRVVLATDQMKIICTNSEQEEAEEELEIDYKGDPLDIGFNITYLLDALQNVAVDKVRVRVRRRQLQRAGDDAGSRRLQVRRDAHAHLMEAPRPRSMHRAPTPLSAPLFWWERQLLPMTDRKTE